MQLDLHRAGVRRRDGTGLAALAGPQRRNTAILPFAYGN